MKIDEINYIQNVTKIHGLQEDEFKNFLINKPFSDPNCGNYLIDVGQVMNLLPPPPAKLLDVGVGSGWTSAMLAMRGYDVTGIDICPDMIELAKKRGEGIKGLRFLVCDYENEAVPTGFDCAVIYDAFHHAENEAKLASVLFGALVDGGILVTVEPGRGHAQSAPTQEAVKKYGTTEKDMPFSTQFRLLRDAGFGEILQMVRITQWPPVHTIQGIEALKQVRNAGSLVYETIRGHHSVLLAKKDKNFNEMAPLENELLELCDAMDKSIKKSILKNAIKKLFGKVR